MPYAYNHQAPPVHTLHTLHTRSIGSAQRFNATRRSVVDPLARSKALGPLGSSHWKQCDASYRQQSHQEQCEKYFSNARGDTKFIYHTIDGEALQVVLLNSTSDKQQSVLANPSTNHSPDHIHMNKCTHEGAHSRLGHPNDAYYDIMVIHNMIEGLDSLGVFDSKTGIVCHDCPHGHAHKRPISHSSNRAPNGPGECIYMDVGGPMPVRGLNDELYFNMAKCRYLGHRVIYFMKGKDEIVDTVSQYFLEAKAVDATVNRLVWSIALIVTDSDKLYMSKAFQTLEKENSINHWFATPYTHSQAAGIESDMRVIGEGAIIALYSSGFPMCMWPHAYAYVVWCKNRSYTSIYYTEAHRYQTPHERRFGIKPRLIEMVAFGASVGYT